MSWDPYLQRIMTNPQLSAGAIYCAKSGAVFASKGSALEGVTPQQVLSWLSENRSQLYINGLIVGHLRCSLVRDFDPSHSDQFMNLKTKSSSGEQSICIAMAKSNTAVVVAASKSGVQGNHAADEAVKTAVDLKRVQY